MSIAGSAVEEQSGATRPRPYAIRSPSRKRSLPAFSASSASTRPPGAASASSGASRRADGWPAWYLWLAGSNGAYELALLPPRTPIRSRSPAPTSRCAISRIRTRTTSPPSPTVERAGAHVAPVRPHRHAGDRDASPTSIRACSTSPPCRCVPGRDDGRIDLLLADAGRLAGDDRDGRRADGRRAVPGLALAAPLVDFLVCGRTYHGRHRPASFALAREPGTAWHVDATAGRTAPSPSIALYHPVASTDCPASAFPTCCALGGRRDRTAAPARRSSAATTATASPARCAPFATDDWWKAATLDLLSGRRHVRLPRSTRRPSSAATTNPPRTAAKSTDDAEPDHARAFLTFAGARTPLPRRAAAASDFALSSYELACAQVNGGTPLPRRRGPPARDPHGEPHRTRNPQRRLRQSPLTGRLTAHGADAAAARSDVAIRSTGRNQACKETRHGSTHDAHRRTLRGRLARGARAAARWPLPITHAVNVLALLAVFAVTWWIFQDPRGIMRLYTPYVGYMYTRWLLIILIWMVYIFQFWPMKRAPARDLAPAASRPRSPCRCRSSS